MGVLGVILFALRLRYDSLTPGWLAHFLFNAQLVIHPLIAWIAPAQDMKSVGWGGAQRSPSSRPARREDDGFRKRSTHATRRVRRARR